MADINRSFKVGRATVTAVDEWTAGVMSFSELFTPYDQALFETRRDLLPPGYSRSERGVIPKIQNWLIQVDGRKIVVDTGFGNGKSLPGLPPEFSNLNTTFLENFRREGVQPDEVDMVLLTHLHIDHVGWNTTREGPYWRPTFSNARHIFSAVERHYWDPTSAHYKPTDTGRHIMQNCFEESVLPILKEGLGKAVEMDARIDDLFCFVPAPGHTPGQVAIKFECDGEGVLFAGDSLHHPMQVIIPEWCVTFDEDPVTSVQTRRRLLGMCADENLVLAPAHFTHQACRVSRRGDGFLATNLEMTDSSLLPKTKVA